MAITAKIPIIPHGVLYQGGFSWVGLFFSDLTFSALHSFTLASILFFNLFKASCWAVE